MKEINKWMTAVFLCCFLVIVMAGCGKPMDEATALEADNTELSKPLYQWYLVKAYDEAYNMLAETEDLWQEKIEDVKAKDWIIKEAVSKLVRHAAIDLKFEELGLEISAEEQKEMEDNLETFWNASGYSRYYTEYGVNEAAFHAALENQIKEQKLYDEEKEVQLERVTEEEINDYYNEHTFLIKYIAIPYPTESDQEDPDKKAETRQKAENLLNTYEEFRERTNSGETLDTMLIEAAENDRYSQIGMNTSKTENSNYTLFFDDSASLTKEFQKILMEDTIGETNIYEDNINLYWIIYEKGDIQDAAQEYDIHKSAVMERVAYKNYSDTIDRWGSGLNIRENKTVTRNQNLEQLFSAASE